MNEKNNKRTLELIVLIILIILILLLLLLSLDYYLNIGLFQSIAMATGTIHLIALLFFPVILVILALIINRRKKHTELQQGYTNPAQTPILQPINDQATPSTTSKTPVAQDKNTKENVVFIVSFIVAFICVNAFFIITGLTNTDGLIAVIIGIIITLGSFIGLEFNREKKVVFRPILYTLLFTLFFSFLAPSVAVMFLLPGTIATIALSRYKKKNKNRRLHKYRYAGCPQPLTGKPPL